ncbi:MAG: alpha-hydroxy-acid oxidizing protein, partial [Microthrixaceae bacterium]
MPNHGDWQLGIYFGGLEGVVPDLPMVSTRSRPAAEAALTPEIWSYVSGGAGNEHTQRANVAAFERWGLMPRVLSGAAEREVGVELFGHQYATPVMLAPVGVLGVMTEAGHGDLATASAAAASGVPMVASTLMEVPMEDVAAQFGHTPGWFQLYPPNDRELCESFIRRAEAAGYTAIVVTLDTLTLGWRPRRPDPRELPAAQGPV